MKEYKIKFRCIGCNKLLAKSDGGGDTEIKCPRCGIINRLSAFEAGKQEEKPDDSDREQ